MRWLERRFSDSPRAIVSNALATGLVVVLSTVWALLQGESGPFLPLIVVGVTAFALVAVNQLNQIFRLRRTDDEWMQLIIRWLHVNSGWSLNKSRSNNDGFHIEITHPSAIVSVSKRHNRPVIDIESAIGTNSEERALMSRAPLEARRDLYEEVCIELPKMGVSARVQADDYVIRRILFQNIAVADGTLTEYRLRDALGVVIRAHSVANQILVRGMRNVAHAAGEELPESWKHRTGVQPLSDTA